MPTILVVDDSSVDRRLAGHLLEKNPEWDVTYASDGSQALSEVELHVPDAVVTDLMMPGMDGLELVAAMKADYPLIPVVLMTAQGSEEIAVKALMEGAASYVPKSALARKLTDTIKRVLLASSKERSLVRLMHRMTRHSAGFVLENDLTLFPSAVSFLQDVIGSTRFCSENERLRVGVALEEALLNAYYHGNLEVSSELREADHVEYYALADRRRTEQPYCDRRIHVEATYSPDQVKYVIRDEGPGFDPDALPDPTDIENLERPCGRGLLLMRTFMNEVVFNEKGNQVTMIKLPNPGSADDETGELSKA